MFIACAMVHAQTVHELAREGSVEQMKLLLSEDPSAVNRSPTEELRRLF